jgi:hypothetical protein
VADGAPGLKLISHPFGRIGEGVFRLGHLPVIHCRSDG